MEELGEVFTIVDTETTGLDPVTCATVQLAAIHCNENAEILSFNGKPGIFNEFIYPPPQLLINRGALLANHVDMVKVMSADPEEIVAERFAKFLLLPGKEVVFTAYNSPFDWGFVCAIQERTGKKFNYKQPTVPPEGLIKPPHFCLLKFARATFTKQEVKNHKLATVAAHVGVPPFNAHDAGEDTLAAQKFWYNTLQIYKGK